MEKRRRRFRIRLEDGGGIIDGSVRYGNQRDLHNCPQASSVDAILRIEMDTIEQYSSKAFRDSQHCESYRCHTENRIFQKRFATIANDLLSGERNGRKPGIKSASAANAVERQRVKLEGDRGTRKDRSTDNYRGSF